MQSVGKVFSVLSVFLLLSPLLSAGDVKDLLLKKSLLDAGARTQARVLDRELAREPFPLWRDASSFLLPEEARENFYLDALFGMGFDSSFGGDLLTWDMFGTLERTGSSLPENTPIFLSFAMGPSYEEGGDRFALHVGSEYTRYAGSSYGKNIFVEGTASFPFRSTLFSLLPEHSYHELVLGGVFREKWHANSSANLYDVAQLSFSADLFSHLEAWDLLLANGFSFQTDGRLHPDLTGTEGTDLFTSSYRLAAVYRYGEDLYFSGRYRYNMALCPNEMVYVDEISGEYTSKLERAEIGHDISGSVDYFLMDGLRLEGYATLLYNSSNVDWHDWSKLLYGVNLAWNY